MKALLVKANIILILLLLSVRITLNAQDKSSGLFREVAASLNDAQRQFAGILFPSLFAEAVRYYNNAKVYSSEGKSDDEITEELQKSKSALYDINSTILERRKIFDIVLAARSSAKASGAEKYSVKLWGTAEDELMDATTNYSDKDSNAVRSAIQVILGDYNTAEEYAEYENYLLTEWEPLKNSDKLLAKLLSPDKYSKGLSIFNRILAAVSDCADWNSIRQMVKAADTLFSSAAEESEKYLSAYPEVMRDRKEAANAGSEIYSVKLWSEGEKALSNAAVSFNNNETDDALRFSQKASKKFIEAKHLALESKILSRVNELILKAKEEDAEKYAPQTFMKTIALRESTVKMINSDNYSSSDLMTLVSRAEKEAELTLRIIHTIKRINNGIGSWEELIIEKKLF